MPLKGWKSEENQKIDPEKQTMKIVNRWEG